MIRFTILLVTLVGVWSSISARTIELTVCSAVDSTAVSGANCRITNEGKFIIGTVSNPNGVAEISTDYNDVLTLNVSMTGYLPTDILIEAGTKNLNLGIVYLDEGVVLNEVTVEGNSLIHSAGRTIVFPSANDVKPHPHRWLCFRNSHLQDYRPTPLTVHSQLMEESLSLQLTESLPTLTSSMPFNLEIY